MKKICCILTILLLSIEAMAVSQRSFIDADSSKIIFDAYGKKGIKDITGKILLPAKYEALQWEANPNVLNLSVIPYKKNGYWGLIDQNYEELTEAKFSSLIPFNENTLIASIKGKYSQTVFYGLIDLKGEIKLAFNYRKLLAADENLIAAAKREDLISFGLIDGKGREVLPFDFYRINYLGLGYFLIEDLDQDVSIRSTNDLSISVLTAIDSASTFKNDLAIIYKHGSAGMLHKSGQLVLPVAYKSIKRNDGKLVEVESYKGWELLTEVGELRLELLTDSVEYLDDKHLVLRLNGKSFLKDNNHQKQELRPLGGTYIQSWDNYFLIKTGERTLLKDSSSLEAKLVLGDFMDANEHFLICKIKEFEGAAYTILNKKGGQMTTSAFQLKDKVVFAKVRGFWGVYTHEFKELLPPIYDFISSGRNEGEFIVKFRGDYGVVSKHQKWEISPEMIKLEVLNEDQYWAVDKTLREFVFFYDTIIEADMHFLMEGKKLYESNAEGYIRLLDDFGKPLMNYVKGSFYGQHENGFLVKDGDDFSLFNFKGKKVFKINGYTSVRLIKDDFMPIKKNGAYGFIDQKGKLRIANRYNDVLPFSEGLAAVSINGRWGFVNMDEDLVIQPYYDKVYAFNQAMAQVVRDQKSGMIDKEGQVLISIEYDSIINVSGYILLLKDQKWGYADESGRIIAYPQFEGISLVNGLILVKNYGEYQLINPPRGILTNNSYDGFYWDEKNRLYGGYKKGLKQTTFLSDLKKGIYP